MSLTMFLGCHAPPAAKTQATAVASPPAAPEAHQPTVVEYTEDGRGQGDQPNLLTLFSTALSANSGGLAQLLPLGGQLMLSREVDTPMFERAWLGVNMSERSGDDPGVLVSGVVADSPAAKAGLAVNDVILLVDGEPIHAPIDVSVVVQRKPVGTHVIVGVARDNEFKQFDATLAAVAPPSQQLRNQLVGKTAQPWMGIAAQPGQAAPSVEQYRGQPLVLTFWRPQCEQCPKVIGVANQWHSRYAGKLHVLGMASVVPAAIAEQSKALGILYPSISDPQGIVALVYGAITVPLVVLVDGTGIIRDVFVGAGDADIERMQRSIASLLSR